MARNKRILVEVDPNQWAALKGQAAAEGRFVRVVLGEAIGAYLARPNTQTFPQPYPSPPLNSHPPTLDELRRSIEGLQRPAVRTTTSLEIEQRGRPKTAREAIEQAAERREWLRTHPEEEGQ